MASFPTETLTPPSEVFSETLVDEMTANQPVDVIEAVIASLDTDKTAMVSQSNGGYTWKFKYGTIEAFVHLTGTSDEDTLTVWARVLKAPFKNEAQLLKEVMELNWSTTLEARFALMVDEIVVVSSRLMADISPGEISRSITIVASLADEYDEPLQAKYC
ncbi:MAG TPA: YbjN domain-containing protein [Leptolyngbyaceae cyanobacterium M33_DOE_097]|uniref:YbjN domain-containing protein n=1 Tax=Oscillatoriales cyanobacterium SpSt-418 TaxID=2282169 RepID=A0A7C3PES5_9CYAN|nr:YbjN domain-containing protein [Leptolyngbyaceae cyanobacterium M33_DOE_097]